MQTCFALSFFCGLGSMIRTENIFSGVRPSTAVGQENCLQSD